MDLRQFIIIKSLVCIGLWFGAFPILIDGQCSPTNMFFFCMFLAVLPAYALLFWLGVYSAVRYVITGKTRDTGTGHTK